MLLSEKRSVNVELVQLPGVAYWNVNWCEQIDVGFVLQPDWEVLVIVVWFEIKIIVEFKLAHFWYLIDHKKISNKHFKT